MPDEDTADFPPHLAAMWRFRHRRQAQGLTAEQKTALNQRLRRELAQTPPQERERVMANLQLDWDALPNEKRRKLGERIEGRARLARQKKETPDLPTRPPDEDPSAA